jgi:hypothetical protein
MNKNNNNSSSDSDIEYILTNCFVKMHNFAFFELKPILSTRPYSLILKDTNVSDDYIDEHIIDVLI